MDISAGLAAVAQGLGIAKTLRDVEKTFDEVTLKARIAEVIDALTDAKLSLAEAKEMIADRDKEIARLKLSTNEKLSTSKGPDNYSYFVNDEKRPIGFPLCPKCEQIDVRLVELKQHGHIDTAQCPICDRVFSPVKAIIHYINGSAYTKQDELREKREAASRRHSAAMAKFVQ